MYGFSPVTRKHKRKAFYLYNRTITRILIWLPGMYGISPVNFSLVKELFNFYFKWIIYSVYITVQYIKEDHLSIYFLHVKIRNGFILKYHCHGLFKFSVSLYFNFYFRFPSLVQISIVIVLIKCLILFCLTQHSALTNSPLAF